MDGAIRQTAETVLPRSSGRPPPLFVVRASKRFWAVGEFALTLPSLKREKEISPVPLLSSFDINGSGEKDQLIAPIDVKYQYYARLRSAAISQASSDAYEWGKSKSPATEDKEASGTGMEIILLDDQVSEVSAQDAPASVRTGSEGVLPKTGDKRPAPSETSAPSPARKKSRAATGPSPALPPLGKKKGVPAMPSLSPSDRRIEEARLEENLSATSDARGNLVAAREQIQSLQVELHSALEALKKADEKAVETAGHTKSLEAELSQTREVLKVSDERAAALEVCCEGVLKQLSSMTEALSERDEAMRQKAEVQQQYGALKADFEELQAQLKEVKAQKKTALARVEVLEQELSTSSDCIRDLALSAEEFNLRHQQLNHEVKTLERKCSALLGVVKHVEGKAQLVREQCIAEYQESDELKKKIKQASEACEEHLDEYKASGEMKSAVLKKAFHCRRDICRPAESSSEESELEGEDVEVPESGKDDPNSEKEDLHLESEIAPVVNVEGSDPRDSELPADVTASRNNVGEGVLTDIN
ncbi:uncharacterized protein LOC110603270 [Manihot esculenta]|uniref:uncharacterized protein LOC110603270 n=1 Tax=Manihot esculenta TaxID=3983 RepID=UPI001CC7EAB6|nr:uncharacterized protein LOC110603270 [Manihot esculenta]